MLRNLASFGARYSLWNWSAVLIRGTMFSIETLLRAGGAISSHRTQRMPPASPHPQSHDGGPGRWHAVPAAPYLRVGLNCRSLHCCWMALAGASCVEPWTNLMATEVTVTLFHHKRAFHAAVLPSSLILAAFLELLCKIIQTNKHTNIQTRVVVAGFGASFALACVVLS